MSYCLYCGKELISGKFCKGHNLSYRNRLISRYNAGDTSVISELESFGWLHHLNPTSRFTPINYVFRKFGIELETVSTNSIPVDNMIAFAKTLHIDMRTSSYGHSTVDFWKVTTDSSLHNGYGREFVSPPFSSEEGFDQLRLISDMMEFLDIKVNSSCGFHVHLDVHDLNAKQIARIFAFYKEYELEIDKLHQNSRRGSNNSSYCNTLRGHSLDPEVITSAEGVRTVYSSRYYKVNVNPYFRQGTIEFRQHGGTCSSIKMIYWVKFCTRVIEYAKSSNRITNSIPLFEALNLSEDEKFYWNRRMEQLRSA